MYKIFINQKQQRFLTWTNNQIYDTGKTSRKSPEGLHNYGFGGTPQQHYCIAMNTWNCMMDKHVEKQLAFVKQTDEGLLKDSGIVSLALATATLLHHEEYIEL